MITKEILNAMFNARNVAVVGASANPDKTGYQVLKNIIDGGFRGRIFPINPKAEELLGYVCFAELSQVPEEIDLVVVIVPAKFVPDVMRQAAEKHAKGAVIISGGFREIGNIELEQEVMQIAHDNNIAVIGPNCQGINYTPNRLCATWPLLTSRGTMAIIAQSGTIGAAMAGWAEDDEIGFTGVVALGNKSGVGEIELLDYFADDPATKVIVLNIEGVADGRLFIETAKRALTKKPVVVLKPGRTARGAEAAASHTKSIAGSDQIFDAVCRQIGLIRAGGIAEFYDFAKVLGTLPKPSGNRLMVVTSSGGSGILAADMADDLGIRIEKPDADTVEQLRTVLPNQCVLSNPLDLTGDATAQRYQDALEVIVRTDLADAYLVIFGDPIEGAAEKMAQIRALTEKPILCAFLGGGEVQKREVPLLNKAGIPVFPTPERAVRAFGALLSKRN